MKRPSFVLLLPLLLAASFLQPGCAILPDASSNGKKTESRYDDASIKTAIASALLRKDAVKANAVNVHCFRGHVFLVGEADREFAAKAVELAQSKEGVVHVTPHWFSEGTADTGNDAALEEDIARRLLFTGDISSRRVNVDVWGGNVVLTGLAASQDEIKNAVSIIKRMDKVKSVTSYLLPA